MPISVSTRTFSRVTFSSITNGHERKRASQKLMARSLQSTLNRLSKWISLAFFGIVLVWRHDAEALWAAMGMVINYIFSAKLKSLLNHKRPDASKRSDPGMPSSHSQSIFYVAFFILFSVLERLEISDWTLALVGLILATASYLSWLRVLTKQHTMSQVLVGAVAGSFCCTFWSYIWSAIVITAFTSYLFIRIIVVLATAGLCTWFVTKLL